MQISTIRNFIQALGYNVQGGINNRAAELKPKVRRGIKP
jgi:hypothetical protein